MNFLSAQRRSAARRHLSHAAITLIAWNILAIAAIAGIALLVGRMTLERNFRTVVERTTLVLRSHEGAFQRIRAANVFLTSYGKTARAARPWTLTLTMITDRIPPNVRVAKLTVDERTLTIEGRAAIRENVLGLADALRGLPFLADVTVPLSNLLTREDVAFTLTARVIADARPDVALSPSR